jgi:hypothetical protein
MLNANHELVGRCGLYCGACIIYRAYVDTAELRQRIAEREGCRPEDIRCKGCQKALSEGWNVENQPWGRNCRILQCLEAKGLAFCYECDSYPKCDRFLEIANFRKEHGENLIENLRRIQSGQVEEWLGDEAEKWKYKECGNPLTMHLEEMSLVWCKIKTVEGLFLP